MQEGEERSIASGHSGTSLVARVSPSLFAFLAEDYAPECANDADECPAVVTGIPFGGTLLVAAGPANHRVTFAEDLAHVAVCARCRVAGIGARSEALNLHQGAHLTTRFAACSQVASRSGPASYHPSGTGARRRLSPSPSKHSHPSLYSLATSIFRWNGFFRRSGVCRRSEKPDESASPPALRRSAFRLSADAGVTSQTSHRFPLESTKVR